MRWLAALVIVALAGGCSVGPERIAPRLSAGPDAPVWPVPPEQARYAFAGVLIGEKDFIDPEAQKNRSMLAWVVGLLLGEPSYVELLRPVSGMVDDQGRILVVDAGRQAVMVFDMTEKRLDAWNEAAEGIAFESPIGIVGDGAGGAFVTDSELGEVFHLDRRGRPVGRMGKGILDRPTGIARDPRNGTLYVADTSLNMVMLFDPAGDLLDTLGRRGGGHGRFNAPTHVAFAQGRLYVADTLNFRVQVFDTEGDHRLAFGKLGLFVGNMTRPKGVAVGTDGRIYVVESYYDHLLVYDADGRFLLPIGGTGRGVGQFYLPNGVWTDRRGRVFVADMFNGRVSVFQELTGGGGG